MRLRLGGTAVALAWACSTSEPVSAGRIAHLSPGQSTTTPAASGLSRVPIPEGAFSAGTEPGQFDRQPEFEPRLERVALGQFEIDVTAYPGGALPPLRVESRDRARQLCTDRGGRLCTELEWERACKGPESLPFSNGSAFDPSCTVTGCPSGFDVRGMGYLREWTASDVEGSTAPRAALRGAEPSEPAARHRCAHRSVAALDTKGIGFRCCYGAPNAARVAAPALGSTFAKLDLTIAELAKLLSADAVTRDLVEGLAYFTEPEATETVRSRGNGNSQGFLLTTSPLLWNPVAGAEFLVLGARAGVDTSFVAVFHVLEGGQRRLASSFVMRNETGPVALAYNGYIRPRLHFSTCWGCPGETGKILYRDPDQAVILQP